MLVLINIWASTVDKQTRISLPVHILKGLFTLEVQKDVLIL